MANLAARIGLHAASSHLASKQTVTSATPTTSPTIPLVLPQEGWHTDSPFVRAYAPALASAGIAPEAFAAALDAVNEALIPDPAVRAVQIGSLAAGLLMPGIALIAAAAGAAKTVHGATERASAVAAALEDANARVFRPAGLSASILNTAQLHALLRLPPPSADVLRAEEEGDESDGESGDGKKPLEPEAKAKTDKEKRKKTKPELPRGIDRLRPYADAVLPVTALGSVAYKHKGASEGMANWGAKTQAKKTARNERRGAKALAKGKKSVDKLVGASVWFVVV